MKTRAKFAAICLAAMLVSSLAGCQLARQETGFDARQDRLIGVLVTREHLDLFDIEGYLKDHPDSISGGGIDLDGAAEQYQDRIYATLTARQLTNEETGETTEIGEYTFPDVEGIPYFAARMGEGDDIYMASSSDEAISDGHVSYNYGNTANSTTLEGTIYISTTAAAPVYYFNPVYQSADGRVYATTGSGMSSGGSDAEGSAFSGSLDASYTATENGKSVTDSTSVKLSVNTMFPPVKITILQMDGDSALITRTEYEPGKLPEVIAPQVRAEYLIVEIHKADSAGNALVSRQIYAKDAQTLAAFDCREDGVCVKQSARLLWPE